MHQLSSYLLGGLVAAYALDLMYGMAGSQYAQPDTQSGHLLAVDRDPGMRVNRALKSDRLDLRAARESRQLDVAAVEIVGVRNTAIVYRDRDGRILFKTDPVANVTIVTKGVLPEVTVRETKRSILQPVNAAQPPSGELPRALPSTPRTTPKTAPKTMIGCDPIVSPLTDPERATRFGKCLAAAGSTRLAMRD